MAGAATRVCPLGYWAACPGLITTGGIGIWAIWRDARELPDGRGPQVFGCWLACLPGSRAAAGGMRVWIGSTPGRLASRGTG